VKTYTLTGRDGQPYQSAEKGLLGGNRRTKVYGTMDCPVALSLLRRGFEPKHRVFFSDEATAMAAGFRPCGACMRQRYTEWKGDASAWRRAAG
jgi:methylphosphotriester-DNA--protein-cysteine methyltransferase